MKVVKLAKQRVTHASERTGPRSGSLLDSRPNPRLERVAEYLNATQSQFVNRVALARTRLIVNESGVLAGKFSRK